MNKPLINTITEPSTLYEQLLGKASLFENDFSVDWLQELERIKTTQVLTILNQGIQKGDLEETGLGVYRFKNKKRRQQLLAGFTREEKEEMNQMAVGILIRELPDEEEKASQLASHLLNMPLETFEDCRWLCKAGDQF
ncbi:hypothetical protein KKA14_12580, partial [bacterium]|nr:hypothetical protein [bacterium]